MLDTLGLELPCEYRELNLAPLEEQLCSAELAAEPALPLYLFLINVTWRGGEAFVQKGSIPL